MRQVLKKYAAVIVLIAVSATLNAQSDLIFSNIKMNRFAYNPASMENNNALNLRLAARKQWLGFPDAPAVQFLNASDFFDKVNMGISFSVSNQSAGTEKQQLLKAGYAYRIYFKGGHTLSLGAGAGILFRKLDFSKLQFDEEEEGIPLSDERKMLPDFEFGMEYHYKGLTAGIASNHITTSDKKATLFKVPVQNHVYVSYFFLLSPELSIEPGIAYHRGGPVNTFDFYTDFNIRNKINIGIKYRTSVSFIIRAGIKINNTFEIDYAYDLGAGSLANYNSGSHEIMLIGRFRKKAAILNTPRFIDQ